MRKNSSDNGLAVLADIHGNRFALEAVLADAQSRGMTRFVNLGDTFYGPLDPAGTWDILKDRAMPTVLGNQDRILLEGGPDWEGVPTFRHVRDSLSGQAMEWLSSLSPTLAMNWGILACHGTLTNDSAYLIEDVSTGLPALRGCDEVIQELAPAPADCSLVLCGHSHHAGMVNCGGVSVVNPGSVGLPAYDDDTPPHIMASGSPHARYGIVKEGEHGWDVEFVDVEYDWDAAVAMARTNGRDDWAAWLATGLA